MKSNQLTTALQTIKQGEKFSLTAHGPLITWTSYEPRTKVYLLSNDEFAFPDRYVYIMKKNFSGHTQKVNAIKNQISKAKSISTLGKVIGMKAKFFAEDEDNRHAQDLDYVLEKMKELEMFLNSSMR